MLKFILLAVALLVFVTVAVTLIVSAVVVLALACAVGIPLYLMTRPHLQRRGLSPAGLNPMERLQNLYIEGKIDLFEFERRVARLIAVEH